MSVDVRVLSITILKICRDDAHYIQYGGRRWSRYKITKKAGISGFFLVLYAEDG
jgi:hypothetical protein